MKSLRGPAVKLGCPQPNARVYKTRLKTCLIHTDGLTWGGFTPAKKEDTIC